MEYYCAMVMTGAEKSFKQEAEKASRERFPESKFFYFERKLRTNQGKYFDAPLFPGYVFFQTEKLSDDFFLLLKSIKNFCRVLHSNQDATKLLGAALAELQEYIKKGEYWGLSKVEFQEGKSVKIISGPLMGLEGRIYKINKKKKRITITSAIFPDKKFDLMYEDIRVIE